MAKINNYEVAKAIIASGKTDGLEQLLFNLMVYSEITRDEYNQLIELLNSSN